MKIGVLLGIISVIITVFMAIYLYYVESVDFHSSFIRLYGVLCLLIFTIYLIMYALVHLISMTDYLKESTLKDLDSDDTKGLDYHSRKIYLNQIISDLKERYNNLIMEYKFYRNISYVLDSLLLVVLVIGGVALIYFSQGYSMSGFTYNIFTWIALFIVVGCVAIALISLIGVDPKNLEWLISGSGDRARHTNGKTLIHGLRRCLIEVIDRVRYIDVKTLIHGLRRYLIEGGIFVSLFCLILGITVAAKYI